MHTSKNASTNATKNTSKNNRQRQVMRERRPRLKFNTLKGNFKLFDEQDGLKLYSEPHATGRKGVVFEGNKQVMHAFPRVKIVAESNVATTPELTLPTAVFFEHHEGTLIRLFWAAGDWRISTQRKINAFNSRWGSKTSFGEAWVDALEQEATDNPKFSNRLGDSSGPIMNRLVKTLDKDKQYLFIVRNSVENRIVCDAPDRPTLLHVGTFVKGKLDTSHDIDIAKPAIVKFESVGALLAHLAESDPRKSSGLMARVGEKWFKVQSDAYRHLEDVRGNEPSLKFRYLQLRLDPKRVDDLYALYPEYTDAFNDYEDTLYDIAKHIHSAYVSRFIRREFVTLEREFFGIMRICHEWHKSDRQYNRVDLDKVIEVMNTRYDHVLNKMIRVFKKMKTDEANNPDEHTDVH